MPLITEEGAGERRKRARRIATRLCKEYPDATCALSFETPLQLLVATILSAQCTDERVNEVTRGLFAKYRSASDFAAAALAELEQDIHSIGMFRRKAQSIRDACALIEGAFGGEVPSNMQDLLSLPGIARKSANVVLGNAFGKPTGVVVDTHVFRLAHRMGLTEQVYREKVESDLMELWPKVRWVEIGHAVILHGRQVCLARRPNCRACCVAADCPRLQAPKPK